MKLGPLLFAGLTIAGLAVGALLAVQRGSRPVPGAEDAAAKSPPSPIELITAKPLPAVYAPLRDPVSLESTFGRSELTGIPVTHVPASPLHELSIDRRWDVALQLRPPRPSGDLPAARASDEVTEPRADVDALSREYRFAGLSGEALANARQGLQRLQAGFALLKEGESLLREEGARGLEGRQRMREAAEVLRMSLESLRAALRRAPSHSELLVLVREAKATLYHAMKHGM